MNNSIFKNFRALLGGALSAIVIFAALQIFFTVRGPQYAEAQPGSVMVRPIIKDTAVKDLTMSVVVALAGGFVIARAINRRRVKN